MKYDYLPSTNLWITLNSSLREIITWMKIMLTVALYPTKKRNKGSYPRRRIASCAVQVAPSSVPTLPKPKNRLLHHRHRHLTSFPNKTRGCAPLATSRYGSCATGIKPSSGARDAKTFGGGRRSGKSPALPNVPSVAIVRGRSMRRRRRNWNERGRRVRKIKRTAPVTARSQVRQVMMRWRLHRVFVRWPMETFDVPSNVFIDEISCLFELWFICHCHIVIKN